MALLPQNPRDQKLVIIGLFAIALVAVYQQLMWTPKNVELSALAVRLDTLDSLNRAAKIEAAKGNATQMRAEADSYDRQLRVLRRLVPTENEVPALLDAVSNAARRIGLEISNFAPDGVIQGDNFDVYRYKIGVTGPYHDVAVLLTNIGSLQRIVEPMNLSLNPTTHVGDRRPRKDEQFLDAEFQIQTYVAHTGAKSTRATPPAPSGAPAAAPSTPAKPAAPPAGKPGL